MAIFRKIYPRCWQSMIGLPPLDKTIALYILSGPQTNRCGIYLFSIGKAIEDLETLPQTFAKGFGNVLKHLSWEYDKPSRIIYIPTWWKWNQPENPNVLIGNLKDLDELPINPLLSKFYANTQYLSDKLIETFTQTLPQTLPQTLDESEAEAVTEAVTEIKDIPLPAKQPGGLCVLPKDFKIEDRTRELLKDFPNLDSYVPWFTDWAVANGKKKRDWQATFRNCVRSDWPGIRKSNGSANYQAPEKKDSSISIRYRPNSENDLIKTTSLLTVIRR